MAMREITKDEVQKLEKCLQLLVEYHNAVSMYFKGSYPSRPYQNTLTMFAEALAEKLHILRFVKSFQVNAHILVKN